MCVVYTFMLGDNNVVAHPFIVVVCVCGQWGGGYYQQHIDGDISTIRSASSQQSWLDALLVPVDALQL